MSILSKWRMRDPVDAQLADIARQGSAMAGLAHLCALALIVLFSAGSLIALSGDAVAAIVAGHVSAPAAISTAVSGLLVVCMDVGMVYAASMLRMLHARRADPSEMRLHYAVMFTVAILEAGTYAYMSYKYEAPIGWMPWSLILARAGAAPALSIYLAMARPLPVGPRDILYQVELATGRGVIRDAVLAANDSGAPLSRKMALYGASAVMTDPDRERLDHMIGVLQSGTQVVEQQPPSLPPPDPQTPPDNDDREDFREDSREWPSLHMIPGRGRLSRNERRKTSRMKALRDEAFDWLDGDPTINKRQLRDLLHCRQETANAFYAQWHHTQQQKAAQQ